jgi:hypothetical protein
MYVLCDVENTLVSSVRGGGGGGGGGEEEEEEEEKTLN